MRERARLRATFGLTEHAYSLQLVAVAGREGGDQLAWANDEDPMMAITEIPQSRSAKFPTLGVLVSLAGVSFRSVFSGLGLVGA